MADEKEASIHPLSVSGGWDGWSVGRDDALMNELSQIGSKIDKSTRNTVVKGGRLTHQQLEELYETNGYVERVIDLPAEDSTRNGWDVGIEDEAIDDVALVNALERVGWIDTLAQADKWSRLYGGAIVLIGVRDGRPSDQPVNFSTVQGIEFMTPLDRHNVTIVDFETSPFSTETGQPRMYRIESNVFGDNFNAGKQLFVHRDRVIHFDGVTLPPQLRRTNDYWGIDVINRCWSILSNVIACEHAMGHAAQEAIQTIWKIKGLDQLFDRPDGQSRLVDRMTAINMSKGMIGMIVADMDRESIERVSLNTSPLVEIHTRLLFALAAWTGIPLVQLVGMSPPGLSSDDQAGTRNWNKKIKSRQTSLYLPKIRKIIRLASAATRVIPVEELDTVVKVEFNPLFEMTDMEKAQVETERSRTAQVYTTLQITSREEQRARLRRDNYLPEQPEDADEEEVERELSLTQKGEGEDENANENTEGSPTDENIAGDRTFTVGEEGKEGDGIPRGDTVDSAAAGEMPPHVRKLGVDERGKWLHTFNAVRLATNSDARAHVTANAAVARGDEELMFWRDVWLDVRIIEDANDDPKEIRFARRCSSAPRVAGYRAGGCVLRSRCCLQGHTGVGGSLSRALQPECPPGHCRRPAFGGGPAAYDELVRRRCADSNGSIVYPAGRSAGLFQSSQSCRFAFSGDSQLGFRDPVPLLRPARARACPRCGGGACRPDRSPLGADL